MEKEEIEFLKESNKIEGETSKEALEDAKHAWNFAKRHRHNKVDIDFIKKIHFELMNRLNPRIAGKIREVPVYIGGECRSQSKEEIIHCFNELINSWNDKKGKLKTMRKQDKENFMKKWHILYEICHGWSDGNGRTGRILMNIQRLELGLPLLIIHEGKEQQEYYKWFKGEKIK